MTNSFSRKIPVTLCVAAGLIMAAAPALAGSKKQFCKNYANTAVWQYKQSIKLECNFNSPYFHPAKGLHKVWCLASTKSAARAGTSRRKQMLSLCQAQGEN